MTTFGKVFSKSDVEAELQTEITQVQWLALREELNDAFEYYFERDVAGWALALAEGALEGEEPVAVENYQVSKGSPDDGGFLFTEEDLREKFGLNLDTHDFGLLVEFLDRAFNKYFQEECENLWTDIESIVEEYLESKQSD
jgi:hypothetical protein